ncbi:MAG: toxin-antitoxin system HicB family antitoxin [Acidobacteriaceae bacterium]|nr:toxin-antitoxin system HicB family antitoxin [Acidobacteriaceae bacterium]
MNSQAKRSQSFPLRLSPAALQQARDAAESEGLSLNHFIAIAVAEQLSRAERRVWLRRQAAIQREATNGLPRVVNAPLYR